ncbi:MFS transporter [Acidipropionibacterium virtanenii]|uniref:Major myo-inositol transporter IolT n=1 Tax=Acidipropionibacterium virtanenii TaxID=2057246 RepID=A0A344UYB4_9ACTN|nr:MFS transporter [Acidipropionibacterium virtanenii]AXE40262.1 Major myo-inositol transporter IolT [Acidipropionibacterium virtanenii]
MQERIQDPTSDDKRPDTLIRQPCPVAEDIAELVATTPRAGKRRSLVVLALVCTFGSLLFGYDTGVIAGALPYMSLPDAAGGLHLNATETGLVGGLVAIGAALGAFYGGKLSDKYGRRHNILLLAVVFFVGALGCTFAPNVWLLYLARIVVGFGVGGASATVPAYLSENAPKRIRGSLISIDQVMIVFGQFLAYSMNAMIARAGGGPEVVVANDPSGRYAAGSTQSWDLLSGIAGLTVNGGNGDTWRYMLVLASLPAIALWIGMRKMPESSRWYAANGYWVEAIGALKQVRDESKDDIAAEITEMAVLEDEERATRRWTLRECWNMKWVRRLLMVGVFICLFDQLTGVNTVMYYLPTILHAAGFSSASAIELNVVTGFTSLIGILVGAFVLIPRLPRRTMGIYQTTAVSICLILLSVLFFTLIEPHMGAADVAASIPTFAPWLVLAVVALFMLFRQSGTIVWVYMGELFPSRARGACQGVAVGALWIMNAIITFVFPTMVESLGAGRTYAIFAAVNVIAVFFFVKFVPETKYESLEELEIRFKKEYS